MRNVSGKNFKEIKTHFMFSQLFLENCAVYDIMWKNVESAQPNCDNMAHKHCMLDTKGYKHTVIFIAFPIQQWLHELASMLRYTWVV
jgi:hypothetical protein